MSGSRTKTLALSLSRTTMWAIASAANEASIFDESDRLLARAPSESVSEAVAAAAHRVLQDCPGDVTWEIPLEWAGPVAHVIPQAVLVLDEDELFIRTDRRASDFAAAQTELLTALRAVGYDA